MHHTFGRGFGALLLLTAGCGTIWARPMTVTLQNMPAGYTVTDNGQPGRLDANHTTTRFAGSSGRYNYFTTSAASLVLLLDQAQPHDVVFTANGQTRTLHYRGGVGAGWVLCDVFFSAGLGLIVDAITGDWRGGEWLFDGSTLAAPTPAPRAD
jgi:hypothetical protein